MDFVEALPDPAWLVIFGAGFCAGGINVIVGSGTLVSFPLLVLLGYPPVVANIANSIGLVPGSVSGVIAYRAELASRWPLVRILLPASLAGGVAGAGTLLVAPPEVFAQVVPWLIAAGVVLVALGPAIRRVLAARPAAVPAAGMMPQADSPAAGGSVPASKKSLAVAVPGAFLLGIYGGYFGAAQGILLMGLLGVLLTVTLQELNGLKNLAVLGVNLIAGIVFILAAPELIDWGLVALIAAGAALGGFVGGRFARRLSARVLRAAIVAVGVTTATVLLTRG